MGGGYSYATKSSSITPQHCKKSNELRSDKIKNRKNTSYPTNLTLNEEQQQTDSSTAKLPAPSQHSNNTSISALTTDSGFPHTTYLSSGLVHVEKKPDTKNLFVAIKRNDFEEVKFILLSEDGPSLANSVGMWNSTPLIVATQYGFADISNYLLDICLANAADFQFDVNHRNDKGASSILFACMEGMTDFVMRLIKDAKANVDPPPTTDPVYNSSADKSVVCTPLSISISNGRAEIVKVLLTEGCDVNSRLMFPIFKSIAKISSPKTVAIKSSVVDWQGYVSGLTPLLLAVASGQPEIMDMLLLWRSALNDQEASAEVRSLSHINCDLTATDSDNSNVLHYLARIKNKSTAEKMVSILYNYLSSEVSSEVDASPFFFLASQRDFLGYTPLHVASDHKRVEVGKFLLECCNANATGLVSICSRESNGFVNGGEEHHADHNSHQEMKSKDSDQSMCILSPLHIAVKRRCLEFVQLLLKHGANPLQEAMINGSDYGDAQKTVVTAQDLVAKLNHDSMIYKEIKHAAILMMPPEDESLIQVGAESTKSTFRTTFPLEAVPDAVVDTFSDITENEITTVANDKNIPEGNKIVSKEKIAPKDANFVSDEYKAAMWLVSHVIRITLKAHVHYMKLHGSTTHPSYSLPDIQVEPLTNQSNAFTFKPPISLFDNGDHIVQSGSRDTALAINPSKNIYAGSSSKKSASVVSSLSSRSKKLITTQTTPTTTSEIHIESSRNNKNSLITNKQISARMVNDSPKKQNAVVINCSTGTKASPRNTSKKMYQNKSIESGSIADAGHRTTSPSHGMPSAHHVTSSAMYPPDNTSADRCTSAIIQHHVLENTTTNAKSTNSYEIAVSTLHSQLRAEGCSIMCGGDPEIVLGHVETEVDPTLQLETETGMSFSSMQSRILRSSEKTNYTSVGSDKFKLVNDNCDEDDDDCSRSHRIIRPTTSTADTAYLKSTITTEMSKSANKAGKASEISTISPRHVTKFEYVSKILFPSDEQQPRKLELAHTPAESTFKTGSILLCTPSADGSSKVGCDTSQSMDNSSNDSVNLKSASATRRSSAVTKTNRRSFTSNNPSSLFRKSDTRKNSPAPSASTPRKTQNAPPSITDERDSKVQVQHHAPESSSVKKNMTNAAHAPANNPLKNKPVSPRASFLKSRESIDKHTNSNIVTSSQKKRGSFSAAAPTSGKHSKNANISSRHTSVEIRTTSAVTPCTSTHSEEIDIEGTESRNIHKHFKDISSVDCNTKIVVLPMLGNTLQDSHNKQGMGTSNNDRSKSTLKPVPPTKSSMVEQRTSFRTRRLSQNMGAPTPM